MIIYKVLLRLYPRVWRARYEEEFLVALASHPFSFFEGVDILRGALDAHLHPSLGTATMPGTEKRKQMLSTLRCSLLTILCAAVGFLFASLSFQKMTEDAGFHAVARTSRLVGLSFHLVVIGAVVALLALLVGSLPMVAAIIRFASAQKRRSLFLLLAVPILACALFLGGAFSLKTLAHPGLRPVWQLFLTRGLVFGGVTVATVASLSAVCLAVAHSEIPEKLLRFALFASLLATISMALVEVSTLIWGLGLRDNAPQLFSENLGLVGTSTTGTWLGIVVAMVIATIIAALSLVRGLSARSTLRTIAA
jgi:hypothetical protein